MLERQIRIYGLDTSDFYSNTEHALHWKYVTLNKEKSAIQNIIQSIEEACDKYDIDIKEIGPDDAYRLKDMGIKWNTARRMHRYDDYKRAIKFKNTALRNTKDKLLGILANKVKANIDSKGRHHIRTLTKTAIAPRNMIAVFDSYFTRTIGALPDTVSEDFMVVTKFYDDMLKDLIYNGYMHNGEKYVYFTSSAGQIRTKKTVFVKESLLKEHEKTLMCGLTVDDINARGGNNVNKHLAYTALSNSATDVWEEFDIDRTIVVDDFETEVYGTYDFIDDVTYDITRTTGHVPIEHTDGAGMMLPNAFGVSQRNMMIRLPWIKGLLGVFDFRRFVEENGCSPVIKDIYGKEHDIVAEDIQVIFTKSQFKMNKFYDSWDDYKEKFKRYECTAGTTNVEEEKVRTATINYQMLQTLTDATDDEIREIASASINQVNNVCSSLDNLKELLNITPHAKNRTYFQQAIEIYPNILNDTYTKRYIKTVKDALVGKCRSGKLLVRGAYTFVLPDLYAACEHWFLGLDNPDGLLGDGEVYCGIYPNDRELDCLRSPHLMKEHAVRRNVACKEYGERAAKASEWFATKAVYISSKDLISRILQCDWDGDRLLVVADQTIVKVAKRNMEDVVPLYYDMKKAHAVHIDNDSIYAGLNAAFTGGNIGIYSNNISKIWNSDVFVDGSEEERKRATDVVKLLCMENNYIIDFAKTLYKPVRPEAVNKRIVEFTRKKVPYFFKYAKDKTNEQVSKKNGSFVNRLTDIVPNPRMNFRKIGIGELDVRRLMTNPDIEVKITYDDKHRLVREETDPVIMAYCDVSKTYYFGIDSLVMCVTDGDKHDKYAHIDLIHAQTYSYIKNELSKCGRTDREVADILVAFLYGTKVDRYKTLLWACYGDILLDNIRRTAE